MAIATWLQLQDLPWVGDRVFPRKGNLCVKIELDVHFYWPMLIQGIKRGRNIELLEDLDIADGEKVTVEVLPQRKQGNLWEAIFQWRSTIDRVGVGRSRSLGGCSRSFPRRGVVSLAGMTDALFTRY